MICSRALLGVLLLGLLTGGSSCSRTRETSEWKGAAFDASKDGYVPDARTAEGVAVAVWSTFYGHERVEAERPYKAVLVNGVWQVSGTLHGGETKLGGTLVIEIAKADGRILMMTHTQ